MIQLKHNGTGSWLDPRCSRQLAAHLSARLWERCRGHKGLVLTLTYNRDPYADPQDLYRRQSEERHVRLFLRKIGKYLGESMTGRWFCKMEFQRGGWVHFHVIILDAPRIPHVDLAAMWGHGFVSVKRLTPRAVKYCTKYLAKDDGIPSWLYGERSRSIKIVRVSPGFWGNVAEPSPYESSPDDHDYYDERKATSVNGYVPIGSKIEDSWDRFTARDDKGKYARGQCDLGPLLAALLVAGHGIVGRVGSWFIIDAELEDLQDAVTAAEATTHRLAGGSPPTGGGTRERGGGEAAALDLIQTSNPHTPWPRWLRRWMFESAEGGAA